MLTFVFMIFASELGDEGNSKIQSSGNNTIFNMFEVIIVDEMLSAMTHLSNVYNRLKQPPRK